MYIISICLYVRNNEDLINQWLQVFNDIEDSQAIELVIVDDGSTDRTLLNIQSFSLLYKGKIKLIMTPSVGYIAAINKAMAFMHGCFYCFVNIYDVLHKEYLLNLPNLVNPSMQAYALYPVLEEERIITKQTALCFLPNLSGYLFHKDVVSEIVDKSLEENILFDVLYQLMYYLEEIACLPYNYISIKKQPFPIDFSTFNYFKEVYVNDSEDRQTIIILMIHHLLIKGLHKKRNIKELYTLQKAIKEIEPRYLENRYLTMYSQKEMKDLTYLKKRLFFLIK